MSKSDVIITCKDYGTFDLAVIGGGCTGVFAAVRAARMGLRVAIVEKSNCFGGVATNGLVNIWHTLFDMSGKEKIIGGLTDEVEQVLIRNHYAEEFNNRSCGIRFDPNALKLVLDELVVESKIKIFFHTFYNSLIIEDGVIKSVIVGNKDGIGLIKAGFFIDATGDGDLCRDAGLESYVSPNFQPPSPGCFLNKSINANLGQLIREHGEEFGLEDDWGWGGPVAGIKDVQFRADFHIFGRMCNVADDLTLAELEGRRKMYALCRLLNKYKDPSISIVALCSQLGIRETVHFKTLFRATEMDLLLGTEYEDTVMRGTYRVDIHHQHDHGITFKYLDGLKETFYGKGTKAQIGNWMQEAGISMQPAQYYQIPFRILVQEKVGNLIPAGRMIHADDGAFGALRVMVNLNQLGEAAGVGAFLSLHEGKSISQISGRSVRNELER